MMIELMNKELEKIDPKVAAEIVLDGKYTLVDWGHEVEGLD